jgi:hypothetical protein
MIMRNTIGRNHTAMILMGILCGCVMSRALTESDAVRIARDHIVSRFTVESAETERVKVQDGAGVYTVDFPDVSMPQEWRQSYWLPPVVMVDKETGRVLNEDQLAVMLTKRGAADKSVERDE